MAKEQAIRQLEDLKAHCESMISDDKEERGMGQG